MNFRILTAPVLILACAGCASGPSKADYSMEKVMPKWQAFMTPGGPHQVLNDKVGKWNVKMVMYSPDGTVTNSTGTSEFSWLFEGRYLQENITSSFENMPFQGRGTTAYDNLKKVYVGTWIDNMGTGIVNSEGTYDASHKTFHYSLEMPDVVRGEYVKSRLVETQVDKSHFRIEFFGPGADGKEMKTMELDYSKS